MGIWTRRSDMLKMQETINKQANMISLLTTKLNTALERGDVFRKQRDDCREIVDEWNADWDDVKLVRARLSILEHLEYAKHESVRS